MTTDAHTVRPTRSPEPGREAPPWWRYAPERDCQVIDWMPGRLVKLRAQLRAYYWRQCCEPLTAPDVAMLRKRLAQVDAQDAITDTELGDLLAPPYGFELGPDGWHVPELLEHLSHANAEAERARARGRRGADARWGQRSDA